MKEIKNNPNFLEDFICMTISKVEDLLKTNTIIGDPIITPSGKIEVKGSAQSAGTSPSKDSLNKKNELDLSEEEGI